MGIAAVAFHWPPPVFWAATPSEFYAAFEAWKEMNTPPEDD